MTHSELERILRIRVHNALRELVVANLLGRGNTNKTYLYISVYAQNASAQVSRRQEMVTAERPLNSFETIEVLVDLLNTEDWHLKNVVNRLAIRNIKVSEYQIDEVFSRYSIKKKIFT